MASSYTFRAACATAALSALFLAGCNQSEQTEAPPKPAAQAEAPAAPAAAPAAPAQAPAEMPAPAGSAAPAEAPAPAPAG